MVEKPKIGTIDRNYRVYVECLDTDTGERGKDWFRLDALWEIGYNIFDAARLVVNVRTVQLGVRE